ncbi:MAG: PD40 domain-containing protein [Fimbriimonadaceae bacterium]|nr:PD40 domain-containing protein [Fimbriimonadaceae bacterium]
MLSRPWICWLLLLCAGPWALAEATPPADPGGPVTPQPPATPADPPATTPATPATPATPTEPTATSPEAASEAAAAGLAPDDLVIFVRQSDLWSVRGDGSGLRQLTRGADREVRPTVSPDGSLIAYEAYDLARSDYDVWTCTAEGGAATKVLTAARSPAWSPDGGRLLFASNRRGSLDIWMANRQGSDLVRVTASRDNEYLPAWSPAGDRIAFVRDIREGGQVRYVITVRNAAGVEDEVAQVLGRAVTSLSWSPHQELLFTARGEGLDNTIDRIYRVAADGGQVQELTSGQDPATMAIPTPGGAGFVYVETRRSQPRLLVRAWDGRPVTLPGTTDGDSEPTILPGPLRRVPTVWVLGRRSFYLPTPVLLEGDILVPFAELAKQLALQPVTEGDWLILPAPTRRVAINAATGEVKVDNGDPEPLQPAPRMVANVPLVPLRAIAERLGLIVEWQERARLLRIGGRQPVKEKPADVPSGPPPAAPDAPG